MRGVGLWEMRNPTPIALPGDLRLRPNDKLYGVDYMVHYGKPTSYGIAPRTWQCTTITGGTANWINLRPSAQGGRRHPPLGIEVFWNYGGAGTSGGVQCDWFRWALGRALCQGHVCLSPHPPQREIITPLLSVDGAPYIALIATPPKQTDGKHLANRYNLSVSTADGHSYGSSGLGGVRCDLPRNLSRLCIINIRLFLATHPTTRAMPTALAQQVTRHAAAAIAACSARRDDCG